MITSLRPYVCRRCIQKLSLQRSAVTSVRHISAAPYAFLPDDGLSKPVQQRVNELGGLVALDQWYPRWRAEEGRPLSAQEFLQKFDEANGRDSTDEPQEERHITVYGTHASYYLWSLYAPADLFRQSKVAPQPRQQAYVS